MINPTDDPECFMGEWRDDDSTIRIHIHVAGRTTHYYAIRSVEVSHPHFYLIQHLAADRLPCDWPRGERCE